MYIYEWVCTTVFVHLAVQQKKYDPCSIFRPQFTFAFLPQSPYLRPHVSPFFFVCRHSALSALQISLQRISLVFLRGITRMPTVCPIRHFTSVLASGFIGVFREIVG